MALPTWLVGKCLRIGSIDTRADWMSCKSSRGIFGKTVVSDYQVDCLHAIH